MQWIPRDGETVTRTWRGLHAINAEGETSYQASLTGGNPEFVDLLRKHGAGELEKSSNSMRSLYDFMRYLTGASILALR